MAVVNHYRTRLLGAVVAATLLVPGAAVHAQDASPEAIPSEAPLAESTPEVTETPPPGAEVLAAMIPTELMGEAVRSPRAFSGTDWLGEQAGPFEQILSDLGRAPEDLSATALVTAASGAVEFQALRIAGADAAVLAEALIPLVEQSNLGPADRETVELAERSVVVLSDADDGSVFAYVYAAGDVVWIAFGDEGSVTALLEQLP